MSTKKSTHVRKPKRPKAKPDAPFPELRVRLTHDEYEQIRHAADAEHRKIADWVRLTLAHVIGSE